MLIQWGYKDAGAEFVDFYFPTTFSSTAYAFVAVSDKSMVGSGGSTGYLTVLKKYSNYVRVTNSRYQWNWIAIGY